jgi:hypothetical protein
MLEATVVGSGKATQHVLSTASSTTLTITDKYDLFAAGDVGKTIRVILRNPTSLEDFEATIVSVLSPTQAVLSQAPTITSTTGEAYWFAGTADDTALVQAAINSPFDVVHIRVGACIITAPLTLKRSTQYIYGDGSWRTTLLARKSVTGDVLHFTDPMGLRLEGFSVVGPGMDAASGGRVRITHSDFDNVQRLLMRDVQVRHLADSGIVIKTPILSTLINCKVSYAAGHGFQLEGGTTTDFINCYAITCVGAGFRIEDSAAIMGLEGCASETCGAGVHIQDSYSINIDHHDCEAQLDRAPAAPAAAPSLSLMAGGELAEGTYWMKFAWMHGEAEGPASAESSIATTSSSRTIKASLGTVPAGVYRAKIYMSVVDGGSGTEGYLEMVTVTPGSTGTYTRSAAFSTVGAAPPTFWYNGHGYVVSNSQKVAIRTVHSRDVPLAASRHFLVTDNSTEVALIYPRVVQGATTPAYDIQVTYGCADNVLDTTLAAARILDNGTRTRWSSTSPGSALGDPVTVAHGGTGTSTPSLVAGTNITISGSWPNQTIGLASPITGTLFVGNGSGGQTIAIDGGAGYPRDLSMYSASVLRWTVRANDTAETGSNAGSDFVLVRRSDTGAFLGYALFIRRSDGQVGIGTTSPGKALDVTGDIRASGQLISTVATGTAPLAVSSTTEVANLRAATATDLAAGSILSVAKGGTGTSTPSLLAGTNITISGSWPNQTVALASPITGTLRVGSGSGGQTIAIDGGAGYPRDLSMYSASVLRWTVRANDTAETGSNAGSDFVLVRRSDTGAFLGYPLFIRRSDGQVGIGTTAPTSALHVVGLPVYANNAAAVAGGLTAGAFYRTGGDPDQVCVVH